MLDALGSELYTKWTGVLHHSIRGPSLRPFSGRFTLSWNKISVCKEAAENEGLVFQSSRTSMRVFENENLPGGGALPSKPEAAIVSVTPLPDVVAELAAAQQSRSTNTSEEALLNRL